MKQTDRVLAFIEENGSISDLEAFRQLGIRRLAARIKDLRDAGVDIETKTESHVGGTHARYFLAFGQLGLFDSQRDARPGVPPEAALPSDGQRDRPAGTSDR